MSETATARRSGQPERDQRGGGSMLMIGVCVVVMMLGYTAMIICGYAIAGHRARSAADLAALSGATTAGQGGDACAAARRNARAHLARVTSCERVGDQIDYVVSVTATVSTLVHTPGLPRQVSATAHAGSEEVGG
ncbi:MAG TPA: Rv3654c family TadE-like protein [Microlunatus sp.]|nr:Rv3654c family TadE-like protein [Microlunatus sp.]